jgi:hypothetical protein
MVELHAIRLHGAVLNSLCRGPTSPLPSAFTRISSSHSSSIKWSFKTRTSILLLEFKVSACGQP